MEIVILYRQSNDMKTNAMKISKKYIKIHIIDIISYNQIMKIIKEFGIYLFHVKYLKIMNYY